MADHTIQIRNKRVFKQTGENVFYVGRPSVLGNPYSVKQHGRLKCINLYERWLTHAIQEESEAVMATLQEICDAVTQAREQQSHVYLVCWCAPKACHAEIIRDVVEEMLEAQ